MADIPPSFEVIGKTSDLLHHAFWWHQGYRDFLETAGVPFDIIENAYEENGKHKGRICCAVLNELCKKGPGGVRVAWQLIDAARALTGPVHIEMDEAAFGKHMARLEDALAGRSNRLGPSETELQKEAARQKALQQQADELLAIKDQFWNLMSDDAARDPVKRGYELEALVGRLCKAHDVGYDPPLRLSGQQIDGAIKFEGKVLVLEVRWRKEKADFGDIQKLSGKARARIVGTLGLFLSMEGFSTEGVDLWLRSGHQRDCILLQGAEFIKVVNGYISWPEALRQMIHQASLRGEIFVSLSIG